ncbi:hypothetical protein BEP19_13015 [Ammoniphilus oxalaticus]|uniref:Uracil-DNA glycosylase-like domain-containing protein n=2 Tax=Ammoniphilus oxalaticus TaxID=66863 RepID=A0A419SHH2_9BACL|nr:hypothetical protein BEP19_13015 [Ammoniphilus oxalaticus]
MTMQSTQLQHYLPMIRSLPNEIEKSDLINARFLMERSGPLEMYYAPHNEYVNRGARLVIVGITPGWTQMKAAFEQAKRSIEKGASTTEIEILKNSKRAARFSGTMRNNLIEMLDQCGVQTPFQLGTSAQLFNDELPLLHTTSLIKYPVFIDGKNYNGHAPKIEQSSLLIEYAFHHFPQEIAQLSKQDPLLIVPLGKTVSATLQTLIAQGKIGSHHFCLYGFPHPSGANGHRKKQFSEAKQRLQQIVQNYSSKALR